MILLLLSALCFGADLPPRPEVPKPVEGQCDKTYGMTQGKPVPNAVAVDLHSASCSAVIVPLSDYADLLSTEEWAKLVATRYKIDTADLERERDWYKAKLEEENQPIPFIDRPSTQRWFGRIETLVTVGVVAVGLGAAYQYGSGGTK
jgi:hypothetical protein